MKKLTLGLIVALFISGKSFADPQVNVADLVTSPVAEYEQAHIVFDKDSEKVKLKAHRYSQDLKRQQQDTDRQLEWARLCVEGYDNGMPFYNQNCITEIKRSEEQQRERVGDAISNSMQIVPALLMILKLF